jgi:hypothetical protein
MVELGATLNPGVEATRNITAADGIPSPHIGGGNDSAAWTGGPNATGARLSQPNSIMAR